MVLRPAADGTKPISGSLCVHANDWPLRDPQADLESGSSVVHTNDWPLGEPRAEVVKAGTAYQETHPAYAAPLLPPPDYCGYIINNDNEPSTSNTQLGAVKTTTNNNNKNKAMESIGLTAAKHELRRIGPAPSRSPCVTCTKSKINNNNNNNNNSTDDVGRGRPNNEQPRSAIPKAQQQKQQQQHEPTTQPNTEHANMTKWGSYLQLFALVFLEAYVLISSYCVSNEWFLADCEAVGGRVKVKVAHGFFSTSTRLVCELSDEARRNLTGS
jgi:hypothetical protein